MSRVSGGYDAGYAATTCFWGTKPGSLVSAFLKSNRRAGRGSIAADLGCGEGKNAAALAKAGYFVEAVDCSEIAISNGRRTFPGPQIQWTIADVTKIDLGDKRIDLVIKYGLLHCLSGTRAIAEFIQQSKRATKIYGHHIICTFNDRSHDLSAHPGFHPTLLPHEWYLSQYEDWEILTATDEDLFETHPHNGIPHHHSLTRLVARRTI
jgi:tellurite methyltransferase